jgi:sugar diacid utilization regulator
VTERAAAASASEILLRNQVTNLQALLVLSMRMTESSDEQQILQLATTTVPAFGACRLVGAHLTDSGWVHLNGGHDENSVATVEAQLAVLGHAGGVLDVHDEGWAYAFPLRSLEGQFGSFVVAADDEPAQLDHFLLRVLAQQTGIALANARSHGRERRISAELRDSNRALADTVAALERANTMHDRLTRVAVAGEGQDAIAQAIHEVTGYPIAIEDRHGNLRAWAGPDRPDPYPKATQVDREDLLARAIDHEVPIRNGDRIVAVARPSPDLIRFVSLVDPAGHATYEVTTALAHGATILARELARLRSVADAELRVRRDLVEEVLSGVEKASAISRAEALGYDLERPHRAVVVVDAHSRRGDSDALLHAVGRAARLTRAGTLHVARGGVVVLLADDDVAWEGLRVTIASEFGGECRIGVGSRCADFAELPRSFREAQLALEIQDAAGTSDLSVVYDDLGVYRLLALSADQEGIEAFVHDWLGALLEYDEGKDGSDLVHTLSQYLECGGSYAETSEMLAVHRSTLKYRLARIKEITELDLTDADSRFNLQLATRAWHTLQGLQAR